MTETPDVRHDPGYREQVRGSCPAVGALIIDGKRRGWLRCSLDAGHDAERPVVRGVTIPELTMPAGYQLESVDVLVRIEPGTPHRAVFEWADDEALRDDWPEAYDPDEQHDVEVDVLSAEALDEIARGEHDDRAVDAAREGRAWPDEQ